MSLSAKTTDSKIHPVELLSGIAQASISEIVDAAESRKIASRHIIIREGHPATHLFLLKSGRAKFYRISRGGDEVLLSHLTAGSVFGLGTLLMQPSPYIGTAETIADSELLVWEQAQIRRLARKHPRLAQNAIAIVLHYLASNVDRLFDLVTCTAAERLVRVMLSLGDEAGRAGSTGVEIPATNEDLAAMANVSPFTVSRLMARWVQSGAIAKSRGKLLIHSPEKLVAA